MNVPRFIRRLFRQPYDGLRHFGVVEEGVLYRCGQPRPAELAGLIQQHKLRTVVSLRGARDDEDPDAWEEEERAVCREQGAAFVTIPFNHKNPPTPEQVLQFLELARGERTRPVLVHCRLGQQRTTMFCALHRVHNQGVAPAEAETEMDTLGFNIRHRRHQRLLEAYRALAGTPSLHAAERSGPLHRR
ncbi:hypothetical protein RAS1_24740 [Phycisphaerae bacterium RAS1]|nr:hypothetical protein RAS1_24740 [Phycisphaerae bacterium RAS1]